MYFLSFSTFYPCLLKHFVYSIVTTLQSQILESLGATVERVRPVSITHKDHFVNIARRRASEANEFALKHRNSQLNGNDAEQINGYEYGGYNHSSVFSNDCQGGFFADQFENLANFRAHYEGTGPEIWEQTNGNLDAFVAAAGTGGTVAGVSSFLQVLPPSSIFYIFVAHFECESFLNYFVLYSTGEKSKHQVLPHRSSWFWFV